MEASDRRAVYSLVCKLATLSVSSRDCVDISGVHMSVCCFFCHAVTGAYVVCQ